MKFAPQSFEERAIRQLHDPDGVAAAANGDCVPWREFADHLAVGTEDGGWRRADRLDTDGRAQWHNERPIGEGVRAYRRKGKYFGCWKDDCAAGRE